MDSRDLPEDTEDDPEIPLGLLEEAKLMLLIYAGTAAFATAAYFFIR